MQFLGAQTTIPATGLSGPNGAGLDRAGNLYIADSGNNRIVKLNPAGVQSVVSVSPLTLNFPLAVVVDGTGNLYVSDNGNNRVVKIPAGGGPATSFASVTTPNGLAIDANGNLFVADNEDGEIVKITSAGVTSNFESGFTDLVDVAVDASGNVYAADNTLSNIVKYLAAGGSGTNVGSSALFSISGVAVDATGNVYVAQSGEGVEIIEITPSGTQSTLATTGLVVATYLTVDSNYNLYIPDNNSNQVIEFSTISVPFGFVNVCNSGAPAPCSQTASLQFALGEDEITNVQVVAAGVPLLDFSQADGTCGGGTSPCTVQVTFQPAAPGVRTGAVLITEEAQGLVSSYPLSGTGLGASAAFSPAATSPPFGADGFQDPFAIAAAGAGIFNGGPYFIADDEACVIWITTDYNDFSIYAGNGTCGYSGDGGLATSAELNSPDDVVVDGAGNLYITDYNNELIRKVDRNGTITTVAGNSESGGGFSGDGGLATTAQLYLPNGVAVDAAGNLYIADSGNNRIRKVDLAGTITTVAGSSDPGYTGDGGPATSAQLNFPLGVRVDTAGNLFIADSQNNVIRKVNLSGTISTVAGNFGLGAGYTGDGGTATSAQLNFPVYVSVDAAGELFISDNGNSVIRLVGTDGTITTYSVPTDFPADLIVDSFGNLAMVDPDDESMTLVARSVANGISFAPQNVNTTSAAQDVSVSNMGNETLTFSAIVAPSGFAVAGDTSCSVETPLNVGQACALSVVFDPTTAGDDEDAVAVTDNSYEPPYGPTQPVFVEGTGVAVLGSTTTTLTASPNPAIAGQSVTLTATVAPTPTGGTLGTVDFCLNGTGPDGIRKLRRMPMRPSASWRARPMGAQDDSSCGSGTLLGTADVLVDGTATLTISSLALGTNSVTALYSGDATLALSTSDPVTETINPAAPTTTTLAASPNPAIGGQSVTFTATVAPTPTGGTLGTVDFCLNGTGPDRVRGIHQGRMRSQAIGRARPMGSDSSCGSGTLLGTENVIADGTATLAISSLAAGTNNVTAVYSGNGTLATSTSDPVTETVNGAATTTITLTMSPSPGYAGQSISLIGAVAPVPTGSSLGTITYCDSGSVGPTGRRSSASKNPRWSASSVANGMDAGPCGEDTVLGSANVMADGIATLTLTTLTVGDHNIYAVYSGTSGFATSTSTSVDETVGAAYTVTAPSTAFPVTEGGSVQITITVPPLGGSFNSAVTLTATGLPPGAIATFNPPTVTPGTVGALTVMTIQLAATASQRNAAIGGAPQFPTWPFSGIVALALASSLRKRQRSRLAALCVFAFVIVTAALALTACNGGFSGSSTPTGQYIVTVTGTSGSLHPSTTVTVVVQ